MLPGFEQQSFFLVAELHFSETKLTEEAEFTSGYLPDVKTNILIE